VLEFDHVAAKRSAVMTMAWSEHAIDVLATEIGRCEVRCVNCHKRVTCARRAGSGRLPSAAPL